MIFVTFKKPDKYMLFSKMLTKFQNSSLYINRERYSHLQGIKNPSRTPTMGSGDEKQARQSWYNWTVKVLPGRHVDTLLIN